MEFKINRTEVATASFHLEKAVSPLSEYQLPLELALWIKSGMAENGKCCANKGQKWQKVESWR